VIEVAITDFRAQAVSRLIRGERWKSGVVLRSVSRTSISLETVSMACGNLWSLRFPAAQKNDGSVSLTPFGGSILAVSSGESTSMRLYFRVPSPSRSAYLTAM